MYASAHVPDTGAPHGLVLLWCVFSGLTCNCYSPSEATPPFSLLTVDHGLLYSLPTLLLDNCYITTMTSEFDHLFTANLFQVKSL